MASCECCYAEAQSRALFRGGMTCDRYHEVMKEHEARGCICTKDTEEGRRARAGQFWDDDRKVDTRDEH